ncbi:hypothetical protein KXR64_22990, partial [Brucella intermedia]|uniref:hypothetical protein n=1 Tax=Brucella TaxID=234 RepID=UPI003B98543D
LSGCCGLKASIIGGAGDDYPANPFQNFFSLAERQIIEIVRQMPGEPAPFVASMTDDEAIRQDGSLAANDNAGGAADVPS